MSFTIDDAEDLLRLLREHPEWKARVRLEVLGEELLSLPELVRQNGEDIRDLQAIVRQNSADIRELQAIVRQNSEDIRALTAVVAQSNANIDALGLRMDRGFAQVWGTMGSLTGQVAELRWRDGSGRFGSIVRRTRLVDLADLERFEAADEDGAIAPADADAVRRLDLLVSGVRGRGAARQEVLLAVEVSSRIERSDVERAVARAKTLKQVGYPAEPVVAGAIMDGKLLQEAEAMASTCCFVQTM